MNTRKLKRFPFANGMNSKSFMTVLILIALLFSPSLLSAQNSNSDKFKENYELKEVVVLSRHNIRAPLSGPNSMLGKVTSHQWTNWTANASELTLRGGVLETMMGQYFRKWLEAEGLFKDGQCPNADDVLIYSNSMQRTIATAEYFQAGFLPTCNRNFFHRFTPSKMDPVFFPRLTKVSEDFKQQAMKEINAMGGKKGLVGLTESLKPSFETLKRVLDMQDSPACKENNICELNDYNTQLVFKLGDEPNLSGSLKLATQIADALILQYFEVPDAKAAAFGKDMTTEDWESISKIKDVYGDILFAAPVVAKNVAHPLLTYINDELNAKTRKFTFLVGHDSNISSVTSALEFEEYSLPNTIEKKTPIGSKLVFEKWQDKATKKEYIRVNMVYQTTEQLRQLLPLNLDTPPAVHTMKISGLNANEFGLYEFSDISARFEKAIRGYEAIK
jgi:glucose-1-phosphatase